MSQTSQTPLTPEALKEAEEFCKDEYVDYMIYSYLAKHEKKPHLKRIVEKLAQDELRHYEFWKKLVGKDCAQKVPKWYLVGIRLMRKVMGLTFTLKWLEKHEESVIERYKAFLPNLEGPLREELEKIIAEEEEHENKLMSSIEETMVKYMSFIVLGLADAIVEITGVHAGMLGVTTSTIIAGVTGLVVGFSAAISMSSAAYLQAKHDPERHPLTSAVLTGIAYILAVVLLALPYFATHNMAVAFTASILLGIGLIAYFTYYSAVVFDRNFTREFLESSGLMIATAFGAFLFGEALGQLFGLQELGAIA